MSISGHGRVAGSGGKSDEMDIVLNNYNEEEGGITHMHIAGEVNISRDSSLDNMSNSNFNLFTNQTMSNLDIATRYDRGSKVCLPKYNIKKVHKQHITPFFSESTETKLDKFKELQKLNLDKPPAQPGLGTKGDDQMNNDKSPLKAGKTKTKVMI
jgi:hypothetical protein